MFRFNIQLKIERSSWGEQNFYFFSFRFRVVKNLKFFFSYKVLTKEKIILQFKKNKMLQNRDLFEIIKLKLADEIAEAVHLINFIEKKENIKLNDYQKFFLQKKLCLVKAHWKKNFKACSSW